MKKAFDLAKAIEAEGLTRERFAAEIGVHPATVYRWLNGDIPDRMRNYVALFFEKRRETARV